MDSEAICNDTASVSVKAQCTGCDVRHASFEVPNLTLLWCSAIWFDTPLDTFSVCGSIANNTHFICSFSLDVRMFVLMPAVSMVFVGASLDVFIP